MNRARTAFAGAIQHDGRIVAAGAEAVEDYNFALTRYNADGTLDEAFGSSRDSRHSSGERTSLT